MQNVDVRSNDGNKIRINQPFSDSYAVTEDVVRKIYARIKRETERIEITIKFATNREIVSENINNVLNDPLVSSVLIESLNITGRYGDGAISDITFGADSGRWGDPQLTASGEKNAVLALERDIQDMLAICAMIGNADLRRKVRVVIGTISFCAPFCTILVWKFELPRYWIWVSTIAYVVFYGLSVYW